MSGGNLFGSIRGEPATVETRHLGKPIGRIEKTSNAKSVPMVPPKAMTPSIFFSLSSFSDNSLAPFADAIMASFSFPKLIILIKTMLITIIIQHQK